MNWSDFLEYFISELNPTSRDEKLHSEECCLHYAPHLRANRHGASAKYKLKLILSSQIS